MRFFCRYAAVFLLCKTAVFAQGYVCAIGGGSEDYNSWSDAPYGWIVQKADSQRIVVLSVNAETQWIPTYFISLGADTAFNLRINTPALANDSVTYRAIRQCKAVFIKGGDQWNYVSLWKNTLTQQAISEVFLAGGVVAGTSAGAMVLSDVVSDAQFGTAVSRSALSNPRSTTLSLTTDFLRLVPNTLIDTHFHERGRFGRLLAMVAKRYADNGQLLLGVGIEDLTALCVSPDGIGEVIGSGSVNFYSPTSVSMTRVAANQPLIFTHVKFDALVAGYQYDLNSRSVSYVLPTAVIPGSGTTEPPMNAISLFGDSFPTPDAVTQFIGSAGGINSAFSIVCPPTSSAIGQRYLDTLTSRGAPSSSLVLLDAASANNGAYASTISNAQGILFASNYSEQFPAYVDSTTLVGQALRQRLRSGVAVAYAQQDARLAGAKIVFRTELEEFAAYRGKLTLGSGMSALRNLIVMPLIFQSDVYDENRSTGLLWGMAKTDGKTGVYLDEGGYTTISTTGVIQSSGPSPAIVVDTRSASFVGFSTYLASGGVGPRQSAAIIGAKIQVISDNVRYNALSGELITSVSLESPHSILLLDNYPNPFNPTTRIRYSITEKAHTRLAVYDMVGREVALLVDLETSPGEYEVELQLRTSASGIYFARLVSGVRTISRGLLYLK
jgi:cyanophycinase